MKFFDKKEYAKWYYQNYGKYGKKKGRDKKMGPMQQSIVDAQQKLQRQGMNSKAPILGPNLARGGSPTRNSINTATRNVRRANNPLTKKKPSRYMESINSASRNVSRSRTQRSISKAGNRDYVRTAKRKMGYGNEPVIDTNKIRKSVSSISRKAKRKGRKIYRKLRNYFN